MFYMLALRKLGDDTGVVHGIARSSSREPLERYEKSCRIEPEYREVDGHRVLCVYAADSELANFSPPDPSSEDEGIIGMPPVHVRTNFLLSRIRPDVERKVIEAYAEIEKNTILID